MTAEHCEACGGLIRNRRVSVYWEKAIVQGERGAMWDVPKKLFFCSTHCLVSWAQQKHVDR